MYWKKNGLWQVLQMLDRAVETRYLSMPGTNLSALEDRQPFPTIRTLHFKQKKNTAYVFESPIGNEEEEKFLAQLDSPARCSSYNQHHNHDMQTYPITGVGRGVSPPRTLIVLPAWGLAASG